MIKICGPTFARDCLRTRARGLFTLALLAAWGTEPQIAFAIPDDFRVFGDDIAERGELGLEFQAAAGRLRPRGGGPRSSERQGLAEISYGIATGAEVSAQFPVAWREGSWRSNGLNLEVQYVGPHDNQGAYWGARVEASHAASEQAASSRNSVEIRPILGYRQSGWEFLLNASARRKTGGSSSKWTLEPSAKISVEAGAGVRLGVEGYSNASREAALGRQGRSNVGLIAVDARLAKLRVNVGVGGSWGAERGGPMVKTVVGFDLD